MTPEAGPAWAKPLTQQQLILELRKLDIRVGTRTVHAWVRSGCPTVPGWRRPRFILGRVLAWLEAVNEVDPLTLEIRDRLYKSSLKRTG